MLKVWEENPSNQNIQQIIECLNDKSGEEIVFIVLNNKEESEDYFTRTKDIIINNAGYDKKVILLWLKTVAEIPQEIKAALGNITQTISATFTKERTLAHKFEIGEQITNTKILKGILEAIK